MQTSLRLVAGNPPVMRAMRQRFQDATTHAPVDFLIDEKAGVMYLFCDAMASLLSPNGSLEAFRLAQDLDDKGGDLLAEAGS